MMGEVKQLLESLLGRCLPAVEEFGKPVFGCPLDLDLGFISRSSGETALKREHELSIRSHHGFARTKLCGQAHKHLKHVAVITLQHAGWFVVGEFLPHGFLFVGESARSGTNPQSALRLFRPSALRVGDIRTLGVEDR